MDEGLLEHWVLKEGLEVRRGLVFEDGRKPAVYRRCRGGR